MTTRHAKTAIGIYETLYHEKSIAPQSENKTSVKSIPTHNSKKDEIIQSINYLKSKKVKTKQDKESIYSLEMVLKNM